jgi:hypothetical protein
MAWEQQGFLVVDPRLSAPRGEAFTVTARVRKEQGARPGASKPAARVSYRLPARPPLSPAPASPPPDSKRSRSGCWRRSTTTTWPLATAPMPSWTRTAWSRRPPTSPSPRTTWATSCCRSWAGRAPAWGATRMVRRPRAAPPALRCCRAWGCLPACLPGRRSAAACTARGWSGCRAPGPACLPGRRAGRSVGQPGSRRRRQRRCRDGGGPASNGIQAAAPERCSAAACTTRPSRARRARARPPPPPPPAPQQRPAPRGARCDAMIGPACWRPVACRQPLPLPPPLRRRGRAGARRGGGGRAPWAGQGGAGQLLHRRRERGAAAPGGGGAGGGGRGAARAARGARLGGRCGPWLGAAAGGGGSCWRRCGPLSRALAREGGVRWSMRSSRRAAGSPGRVGARPRLARTPKAAPPPPPPLPNPLHRRQETAQREARIREEVTEMKRTFYCEVGCWRGAGPVAPPVHGPPASMALLGGWRRAAPQLRRGASWPRWCRREGGWQLLGLCPSTGLGAGALAGGRRQAAGAAGGRTGSWLLAPADPPPCPALGPAAVQQAVQHHLGDGEPPELVRPRPQEGARVGGWGSVARGGWRRPGQSAG